jgi:hypothetical protein
MPLGLPAGPTPSSLPKRSDEIIWQKKGDGREDIIKSMLNNMLQSVM